MKSETFDILKKTLVKKWAELGIKRIGVGVSGGPDSMVLLSFLCSLCEKNPDSGMQLFVLTIDHNMRLGGVSAADSDFVLDWVEAKKTEIPLLKIWAEKQTFEPGLIDETAEKRGRGHEEAARFLRYSAFEDFASRHNLDVFCTAHNQNDAVETLVQRFLQGASPLSSGGILEERGIFFRPLLNVQRKEILAYAEKNNVPFRIDATNNENVYFRNKIRNCLVPFLDEHFSGWQTGVLHGAEKMQDFAPALRAAASAVQIEKKSNTEVSVNLNDFKNLDTGSRIQVLCSAFLSVGVNCRVPYAALKECALSLKMNAYGICVKSEGQNLVIGLDISESKTEAKNVLAQNSCLEHGFYMLITSCGHYVFPQGFQIDVSEQKNDESFGPFAFPLVIRNRQSADKIRSADGSLKKLSRIFSDWKVPESLRDDIPVVETQNTVCAVMAAWCGYKDWLVNLQDESRGVYISMRKI